jgi:hypothetical protein
MSDEPIDDKNSVTVRSMYGSQTRQPLVSLRVKDVAITIEPDVAREIGRNLIEAAEAAHCDVAIFRVATEGLGLTEQEGARFLMLFRKFREDGQ